MILPLLLLQAALLTSQAEDLVQQAPLQAQVFPPSPAPCPERVLLLHETLKDVGTVLSTAALDLHSTEYALAHGAREGNPLGFSRSARMLTKVALSGAVIVGAGEFRHRGHYSWARWTVRAIGLGHLALAANNYFIAPKRK